MERLIPNNSDTKPTQFKTDGEALMEKRFYYLRQRVNEFIQDQLAYCEWQRKQNITKNKWKWLFQRQKYLARVSCIKFLIEWMRKTDEELHKITK